MASKLIVRDGRYFVEPTEAEAFIVATERRARMTREQLFERAASVCDPGETPHVAVSLACGCVYEILRSPRVPGWRYEVERIRLGPDHIPFEVVRV
jgi:hypothetical protein